MGRLLTRLLLLAAGLALSAPEVAKGDLALEPVGRFTDPVHVAGPPGDPRVFVVEKGGRVLIPGRGTFLDVSNLTENVEERGLLSIAFPPDHAATGRFYVFMTSRGMPYRLRVVEYRRSADPDRADPSTARVVLSIPHPADHTHNGGQLQFGPDGMLYVSTGDGGGVGDPFRNAQDLGSELGKILRIDPRTGKAAAGNPFGTRVWAYGLRNPWRFSFDRATGALWIGDVGQGEWEEVDALTPAAGGRGANLGWPCWEGGHRYRYRRSNCRAPEAIRPVLEQPHAGFCAIVGGYVVRDPGLPTLLGRYLYGDLCHPVLRSTAPDGTGDRPEPLAVAAAVSFGEDACHRLYVASLADVVYRIRDGTGTPCPYRAPTVDTTPPRVRFALRGLRSALERRRLRVRLGCDEPCTVQLRARVRGIGALSARPRSLFPGRHAALRLLIDRAMTDRLERAVRRRGSVGVAVSVAAQDAAGNERHVTRRRQIRRG